MPDTSTPALSPVQAQVALALASGHSITGAAKAAGIHRSTVHNWLKHDAAFSTEFDTIRQERVEILRDEIADLELAALNKLKSLIEDPGTPPSVALRAALAVLERPKYPFQTWSLPERVEAPRRQELVDAVAQVKADYGAISQKHQVGSTARNAPCPCGSGNKYKRCCGKHAPPLLNVA